MRKNTTEIFIDRARSKFNNRYDYTESIYLGAKQPLKIKCGQHGDFWQKPEEHLRKNSYGCPDCAKEGVTVLNKMRDYSHREYPILLQDKFLERAYLKFGNKFTFDLHEYNGLIKNEIVVFCPVHGRFDISPENFLNNKNGCNFCGRLKTSESRIQPYEAVIHNCNIIYNFKYRYPDYNKANYKNKSSKIDIICPQHGVFKQTANTHFTGRECHKCTINHLIENNLLIGGYSEKGFDSKPYLKDMDGFIYYLKINNGKYYKIGITKNSIHNRIKSIKSKAKKFNKILDIDIVCYQKLPLLQCFRLEQEILSIFSEFRIFRRWSTELFSKNIFSENLLLDNRFLEGIPNLCQTPIN